MSEVRRPFGVVREPGGNSGVVANDPEALRASCVLTAAGFCRLLCDARPLSGGVGVLAPLSEAFEGTLRGCAFAIDDAVAPP
jgi:hypothetical protein